MIKLEVGRTYKVREGYRVTVTKHHYKNDFYPYEGDMVNSNNEKIGMTLRWTASGNYWHSKIKSKWDIVKEVL